MLLNKLGEVITAVFGPLTCDQVPVPTTGAFPARIPVVWLQTLWSAPAKAIVGISLIVTTSSDEDAGQLPLFIVHLKV